VAVESHTTDLIPVVALLGAAVVAVPIFKRLGLGSVLGYLVAGIAIGPFGLRLFTEPEAILSVAEIGVVLLLFVIGLEMKPSRLWSLRREIFGLGLAQVVACSLALTAVAHYLLGISWVPSFIGAAGFTLTSTAIVLQLLEERGETAAPAGQKIVSILLLEDLTIVPLLAVVALLSPIPALTSQPRWLEVLIALAAVVILIAVARYLLNPVFRILAEARAREVMTAAALLVVLGAALLMDLGGLSMAMGAFVAGVLLSESSFRHQLEADIEPFRGLLLGLFFLAVGMSLDVLLVVGQWMTVAAIVVSLMAVKAAGIYGIARLFRARHPEAVHRALLMAQGGEFAFVLYNTAMAEGVIGGDLAARFNAAVIVSMAITPLLAMLADWLGKRMDMPSFEGIDVADGLSGTVLLIGFGRFGQVAAQALLSRGIDVSIIDMDVEMIQAASRFGFKIYYGDGTRLDVLRAAGAGSAKVIAICVDRRESTDKIVAAIKEEFPLARIMVRSFDRGHTLDLIAAGVDYQIRETFESALTFGREALRELGVPDEEADDILAEVRRRDAERLQIQITGGIHAGHDLMRGNVPTPGPLTKPQREARPLSEETAVVAAEDPDKGEQSPA
jgi:glutathione-regulated potassium-efflux system protein KefB